jgi:hypothetical protein
MNASIRRNQEKIIVKIAGSFSQLEAEQLCKRIEAMLKKTSYARLFFAHSGKLALEVKNYSAWGSLLACLRHNEVKVVCFVFDKENTPFRFLAQEYARRAAVPCIQRDKLDALSVG